MAGEIVSIEGIEEACDMLTQAPRRIVARAFLKALEAGADVIRSAVDANTPTSKKVFDDEGFREFGIPGDLKKALMVAVELDSQFRGGSADIGFGKQGHVALWVEYGHRMIGHKPGKKALGQVEAHPFMRPAADQAADAAIEAFTSALMAEINAMRAELGG